MPIDDALEELKESEKGKKKKEEKKEEQKREPESVSAADATSSYYQKPWHEGVMKSYIYAINKFGKINNFDASVLELYAPWIRLANNLSSKIIPVPKKRMIEIFKSRCAKETKELLENSDLNEFLEEEVKDPFYTYFDEGYERIPDWMKFKETVGYDQLKLFKEKLSYTVFVPDLTYMSIFVKDGDVLREYAKKYYQMNPKAKKLSLMEIHSESLTVSTDCAGILFSPDLLVDFCRETGIKNIKNIVRETNEILKRAISITTASRIGQDPADVSTFRSELYKRVKKYNPDLAMEK